MDMKKSPQHYKLKGATRILADRKQGSLDEPNKSASQDASVDSTTGPSAATIYLDHNTSSNMSMVLDSAPATPTAEPNQDTHMAYMSAGDHHQHNQQQHMGSGLLASSSSSNYNLLATTAGASAAASMTVASLAAANAASASNQSPGANSQSTHQLQTAAFSTAPRHQAHSQQQLQHKQQHQHSGSVASATAAATAVAAATAASAAAANNAPQMLPCDIKSLFECPICFDYAVPPIYQCQNGHLVCQCCSAKITHCPTCRVAISEPSIRNLQLDRLANTFQFPCKYNFNGCLWRSYWFKKREHEENCDYISYSCPCPGTACKWTGLLNEVMPHLSEHHKSITTLRGEDIVFLATDINLKGAVDWVMIQSCFEQHFLLVLEKQELKTGQQQFFAVVQLIGSQKEAEKFKYKLELGSNSSGHTKRLQWEATPRSILDGIQSAISTHDCLVFDARTAQHFLSPIQKEKDTTNTTLCDGQGENLGINVTIDRRI